METGMVKLLLDTAQFVLKTVELLIKGRKEDNERTVDYLASIATCLEKIASNIRSGKPSIQECYALCIYLKNFPDTMTKYLENDTYETLFQYLIEASKRPGDV